VGQVAVTRHFARQYVGNPARRDGVLINAGWSGLTLTK
jgi:hypothetical protein